MFVDSHCHLTYEPLNQETKQVIDRAHQAGVQAMLTVATELNAMPLILALTQEYDSVYGSVGVHPCHVEELDSTIDQDTLYQQLSKWCAQPKIIALGETGLDLYHDDATKTQQIDCLRTHMTVSQEQNKPLIIHSRQAETETIEVLKSQHCRGVIHCFTGSLEFAKEALDCGFYISIAGIVTFKNAHALQQTMHYVPLDRLLIETDSPYLAPVPFRGKPCEPAYVAKTAQFVADLKQVDIETFARQTTANFYTLFTDAGSPERKELS